MTDPFLELIERRDQMIKQYWPHASNEEQINLGLFLIHGDKHLASVSVPTRIVTVQNEIEQILKKERGETDGLEI